MRRRGGSRESVISAASFPKVGVRITDSSGGSVGSGFSSMSRAVSLDGGVATTPSSVTLSQLALRAKYAVDCRLAERFDSGLDVRAGNAHKSAAFLEEDWLIGAGCSCRLVDRVNRRPSIGDHVP